MQRYIIDVREPEEFARGHVDGAINISPTELMGGSNKLNAIPKDGEVILYCVSGSRSNMSMGIMRSLGYADVTNGINKQQVSAKYGYKLVD